MAQTVVAVIRPKERFTVCRTEGSYLRVQLASGAVGWTLWGLRGVRYLHPMPRPAQHQRAPEPASAGGARVQAVPASTFSARPEGRRTPPRAAPRAAAAAAYPWQSARGRAPNYGLILDKRRAQLREMDLASDPALLAEWNELIRELDAVLRHGFRSQLQRVAQGGGRAAAARPRSNSFLGFFLSSGGGAAPAPRPPQPAPARRRSNSFTSMFLFSPEEQRRTQQNQRAQWEQWRREGGQPAPGTPAPTAAGSSPWPPAGVEAGQPAPEPEPEPAPEPAPDLEALRRAEASRIARQLLAQQVGHQAPPAAAVAADEGAAIAEQAQRRLDQQQAALEAREAALRREEEARQVEREQAAEAEAAAKRRAELQRLEEARAAAVAAQAAAAQQLEQQRVAEAERERESELERQRLAEAEREREEQLERQRLAEAEARTAAQQAEAELLEAARASTARRTELEQLAQAEAAAARHDDILQQEELLAERAAQLEARRAQLERAERELAASRSATEAAEQAEFERIEQLTQRADGPDADAEAEATPPSPPHGASATGRAAPKRAVPEWRRQAEAKIQAQKEERARFAAAEKRRLADKERRQRDIEARKAAAVGGDRRLADAFPGLSPSEAGSRIAKTKAATDRLRRRAQQSPGPSPVKSGSADTPSANRGREERARREASMLLRRKLQLGGSV